ncbi:MAG: putative amidohydrolase YtcJ [Halioglobus sp.]|jgi:predicted amidohydrolase YtcJ
MTFMPLFRALVSMTLGFSAATNAETSPLDQHKADSIFYGGDILTMGSEKPEYAEALVVSGDKITFVGDKEASLSFADDGTKLIDLNGQTLLPGFIDPHSHVYGVGLQAMVANLLPPPDGQSKTVGDIVRVLSEAQSDSSYMPFMESTGIIIGFGYDDAELDRYPLAADLDKVSKTKPVVIIHTSGHLSVINNAAMTLFGITADSKNPQGGLIRRKPGSKEPNGVLEENAHFNMLFTMMSRFDDQLQDEMLKAGQQLYAKFGYTTVQEGRASKQAYDTMARAAEIESLLLDVVAYVDMVSSSETMASPFLSKNYKNRFRLGGVKLNFDGSPQGKTAWLTEPYFKPPNGQPETYAGYPTFTDEQANQYMSTAFENDWQVLTHANGDAAIEQFINAVEGAIEKHGKADRRTVLIHGQTMRQDQVDRLKDLDIFPSLYPMHTFYWGDWHAESVLGQSRAAFISPTHAVRQAGLMFSTHHDAPVALPSSFRVLDATVNRTTRTKKILGKDQRVDPYTALRAMTIWPAYQHFEQDSKGSLEAGKQADLVILNANPLKVPRAELINLVVDQTISRGKIVYQKN